MCGKANGAQGSEYRRAPEGSGEVRQQEDASKEGEAIVGKKRGKGNESQPRKGDSERVGERRLAEIIVIRRRKRRGRDRAVNTGPSKKNRSRPSKAKTAQGEDRTNSDKPE